MGKSASVWLTFLRIYAKIYRQYTERLRVERNELPVSRTKNAVWLLLILPGTLFVILFMLVPLFSL